ncbi:hypothetical protein [Caulobacter phage Cr30]|uniref:hypothetical protein n=1 Tax=Caulobacter phage Cr30 TaxID=1357714 RepID=UPI0004A9B987|nr:hypothetical protein OZ74_gp014 [Caulobacter phage Cr30]AGS80899.1 hypothetical protein [Caulobacter phage Cr30]
MLGPFVYNEVHNELLKISTFPDDPDWLMSATMCIDHALCRSGLYPLDYRYRFSRTEKLSVTIHDKHTNEIVLIVDL